MAVDFDKGEIVILRFQNREEMKKLQALLKDNDLIDLVSVGKKPVKEEEESSNDRFSKWGASYSGKKSESVYNGGWDSK